MNRNPSPNSIPFGNPFCFSVGSVIFGASTCVFAGDRGKSTKGNLSFSSRFQQVYWQLLTPRFVELLLVAVLSGLGGRCNLANLAPYILLMLLSDVPWNVPPVTLFVSQENASDKWDIPWYTMRELCITFLYHAIENIVANTTQATYVRPIMRRLDVILSSY